MNNRSNSTKELSELYEAQAELAESIAERAFREALARRAERDAFSSDARVAEIEERERALDAREQLIRALENRLEDSRRRLEERLQQMKERRPAVGAVFARSEFQVPSIDDAYFDAGSQVDEDGWWSRQLGGKPPRLAA
jgi:hypothetical protein